MRTLKILFLMLIVTPGVFSDDLMMETNLRSGPKYYFGFGEVTNSHYILFFPDLIYENDYLVVEYYSPPSKHNMVEPYQLFFFFSKWRILDGRMLINRIQALELEDFDNGELLVSRKILNSQENEANWDIDFEVGELQINNSVEDIEFQPIDEFWGFESMNEKLTEQLMNKIVNDLEIGEDFIALFE